MRRWILGALAVVVVAIPVVAIGSAFMGNVAVEPGRTYADGRVTTVFDTYVSCFLIDVGDGHYVLVDACMDPEAQGIQAALAARGASLSDVLLVLLTHGHADHVGGVAALPHVPVRALAAELPHLSGSAPYRGPLQRVLGTPDTGVRVTQPLVDGETIQVGDTPFEVFALPGHTAGSAAYLVRGVLLLGDSAGYKASGTLVGAPWVFSDDTADNVASLRALDGRLKDRPIDWLVPAHTGPAPGTTALHAL